MGALPAPPPPTDQNFFNFMVFSRKCINILGRRPLLRQVLDPPPVYIQIRLIMSLVFFFKLELSIFRFVNPYFIVLLLT